MANKKSKNKEELKIVRYKREIAGKSYWIYPIPEGDVLNFWVGEVQNCYLYFMWGESDIIPEYIESYIDYWMHEWVLKVEEQTIMLDWADYQFHPEYYN